MHIYERKERRREGRERRRRERRREGEGERKKMNGKREKQRKEKASYHCLIGVYHICIALMKHHKFRQNHIMTMSYLVHKSESSLMKYANSLLRSILNLLEVKYT